MQKLIIGLFMCVVLSACATKVEKVTTDRDKPLSNDMGYVLFSIESNIDFEKIHIDGERAVYLTSQDLRAGTRFMLVPMKAGNYAFERISLAFNLNYSAYIDLAASELSYGFNVKPGTISYIGNLHTNSGGSIWSSFNVLLQNHSSTALIFLEQNYPNLLETHGVTYGGPGEDNFFEKVMRIKASRKGITTQPTNTATAEQEGAKQ